MRRLTLGGRAAEGEMAPGTLEGTDRAEATVLAESSSCTGLRSASRIAF